MDARELSRLYRRAHNRMRDVEGLLPQEAFDELLKFLFFKDSMERREQGHPRDALPLVDDPKVIRQEFSMGLAARVPWARQVWRDGRIHLSDRTLLDIQEIFSEVRLSSLSLDVRSVALRTFLRSGLRKGLGVFLTPEAVVRAMVDVAKPTGSDVVVDPACGSGTFLIEASHRIALQDPSVSPIVVRGIDKNPRMLLLAYLNFGHRDRAVFRGACADTLRDLVGNANPPLALKPNSVDLILTNPPFGVTVTEDSGALHLFGEEESWRRQRKSKLPSEVLFVGRCLELLRPGGRLGIVLPRSVITNESLFSQRRSIDRTGRLTSLIDLPAETFSATGTQTTTVVAFFRKKEECEERRAVSVSVCYVTNVGFDSTGRTRAGDQLPELARRLAGADGDDEPVVKRYTGVPSSETLQRAASLLFRRNGGSDGPPFASFVLAANTGRTPSRQAYTNQGVFILKVGNLTGHGIDWKPRERNFVSPVEGAKRLGGEQLRVREGDILLTSSAHAPRYIAKKVDIVSELPEGCDGVTFVGELIRVRPAADVDPFVLLAALRQRDIRQELQACVRGQTAHLNPKDLLRVSAPWDLRTPPKLVLEIAALLRREADLACRLNAVSMRANDLLASSTTALV